MGKPTSWVYFVQAGENGPIKIGFTAGDPSTRMGALQTGNPERLRLLVAINAGQPKEIELHKRFASLRMAGEWFRPEPALLGFIEALQWSSDVEHYEAPPGYLAHGLCEEQVRVVVGYMQAQRLFDRAYEAAEHFEGRGKLDLDEIVYLLNLRGDIAALIGRVESFESISPDDDGVAMFGGQSLRVAIEKVRAILSNHGMAIAEARLTEEPPHDVCAIFDHDDDWGPLSDGPATDPRGLN